MIFYLTGRSCGTGKIDKIIAPPFARALARTPWRNSGTALFHSGYLPCGTRRVATVRLGTRILQSAPAGARSRDRQPSYHWTNVQTVSGEGSGITPAGRLRVVAASEPLVSNTRWRSWSTSLTWFHLHQRLVIPLRAAVGDPVTLFRASLQPLPGLLLVSMLSYGNYNALSYGDRPKPRVWSHPPQRSFSTCDP